MSLLTASSSGLITESTIPFIMDETKSRMNFTNASNAFFNGCTTLFSKYVQFPVTRPIVRPMNTSASHFAMFPKNTMTATTAFQMYWNTPVIVFQTVSHQFRGGGAGGDAL